MPDDNASASQDTPTVTFDQNPVKAGVSKLSEVDVSGKVKATVTPKSKTSSVSFGITGPLSGADKGLATFEESSRDNDNGIVMLKITGKKPTDESLTSGNQQIQAKYNGAVIKTLPVQVVAPKYQSHSLDAPTLTNDGRQQGGNTELWTTLDTTAHIVIYDQFWDILTDIWNKEGAVLENFIVTARYGDFHFPVEGPGQWGEIELPSKNLTNGLIDDYISLNIISGPSNYPSPAFSEEELNSWIDLQLLIPGDRFHGDAEELVDNAFQFSAAPRPYGAVATQSLKVHGWVLKTKFKRTVKSTNAKSDPVPFDVSDEEQ